VGLLGASTESRLLTGRLQTMRLENALKGLGRRATAGAATTAHRRRNSISSGSSFGHFVYWMRETFMLNAEKLKMEPLGIIAIVGIAATALVLVYYCKRKGDFGGIRMVKSSSNERLSEIVHQEDPIQVSS